MKKTTAIAELMNDKINLDWFIHSEYFQNYEESYFHNLSLNDQELYERCMEAAEFGSDGRTHREIIHLWISAWDDFANDKDIPDEIFNRVAQEINDCEKWHINNGSIDNQLS